MLAQKDHVPEGYETRLVKNGYVLAEKERKDESDGVLPVCYGTTAWMSRADYEKLSFPENMEALCNYAVLDNANDEKCSGFTSHFVKKDITDLVGKEGKRCLQNLGKRRETIQLALKEQLSDYILVLQFHVNRADGKAVEITVNGTKNKLSSVTAPYPNGNDTFTYILESGRDLKQLEVTASKGNYRLEDMECYFLLKEHIKHKNVTMVTQMEDTEAAEQKQEGKGRLRGLANVFKGCITMEQDGYFVTSFPYRRGYRVTVDGRTVNPEIVNTTFLGFPIRKGTHRIEIHYTAPGYRLGLFISLFAFAVFAVLSGQKK